jgi:hypothetical protein
VRREEMHIGKPKQAKQDNDSDEEEDNYFFSPDCFVEYSLQKIKIKGV